MRESTIRPHNDEKGEGFYFLQKPNEAKTLNSCATRGFDFVWILRYTQYDERVIFLDSWLKATTIEVIAVEVLYL